MKKRGIVFGAGAAGALALAAAFANSTAPATAETPAPVVAAETQQVPQQQLALNGHDVTLTYGPGISQAAVDFAIGVVMDRGCPATAIGDGFPESVEVETNGQSAVFDDPADAAGWALDHCK